jgi:hypothetical protein
MKAIINNSVDGLDENCASWKANEYSNNVIPVSMDAREPDATEMNVSNIWLMHKARCKLFNIEVEGALGNTSSLSVPNGIDRNVFWEKVFTLKLK